MYGRIHHRWPFRLLAEAVREREFFATHEWRGLHLGVFESFAAARAFSARHGAVAQYDLDHTWWMGIQSSLHLHDYPTIYWLNRVLVKGSKVADLGGSIGVSYYAFKRFLALHSQIEWRVCELPDVVEHGRQLARKRGARALSFTDSFKDLDGYDVLLAAGSLQFIEPPLSELLQTLHSVPRYLLINRIPVHDSKQYVTLQNTGTAIAPCHVFNRAVLYSQLHSLGYEGIDEWSCTSHALHIPLHPEYCLSEFKGFCFERSLHS
jgi:putative methyltransferase (TIGR04325 family)